MVFGLAHASGTITASSSCYTSRVRAAISVPDELFAETEEFAWRQKRSRSEVVRDALREYLARHDAAAITAALNRVLDVENSVPDSAFVTISAEVLRKVEW